MSDWYYFAIVELTALEDFRNDPHWIAARLGISDQQSQDAIEVLLKLGLLERKGRALRKTLDFRATTAGVPSRAIKQHHQQILKKAETALYHLPLPETDFSSTIFTMAKSDLDWARKEIKKFRRELTQRLSRREEKDCLYELAIQLFPLDQKERS